LWLLRNFREVEPSKIYAGGYQHAGPLRKLLDRYRIKTVLSLMPDGSGSDLQEQEIVGASGARFVRVSILSGDTEEDTRELSDEWISAKLESVYRAVDIMADPENQPVFVHCWGGQHRTGAVIAVYRVVHSGWTEEDAREELSQWGGFANGRRWPAELLHASRSASN
jgi:tyrosine-protein phosphatase SIW14